MVEGFLCLRAPPSAAKDGCAELVVDFSEFLLSADVTARDDEGGGGCEG